LKTLKNIVAVPALIIAVSLIISGCGRWMEMPVAQKADMIAGKIASDLDLTPEQKAKMESAKTEIVSKLKEQSAKRIKLQNEIIALVMGNSLTKGKIVELNKKRNILNSETEDLGIERFIELHKMLTQEQKEKVAEFLKKQNKQYENAD
jgi:Spy/CpxP family protein refolding chaperone